MRTLVVDASVAIKWVVPENGSREALSLLHGRRLVAPDLLVAECADILWKKVTRGEITATEAEASARLLEQAAIDLLPMRELMRSATETAIRLSHPAYDCIYLSLAVANGWTFVTADAVLVRKFRHLASTSSCPPSCSSRTPRRIRRRFGPCVGCDPRVIADSPVGFVSKPPSGRTISPR